MPGLEGLDSSLAGQPQQSEGFDWRGLGDAILAGSAAGAGNPRLAYEIAGRRSNEQARAKALELQEEKLSMDHLKNIFAVGKEIGDDDTRTKFLKAAVKASPVLNKRFGEIMDDPDSLFNFNDKGEVSLERKFASGELIGPDGKPLAEGTYKVIWDQKGIKPGQTMPIPKRIETGKAQDQESNELGKINQADWTPESFKEYVATKDRTKLVPIEGKGPSVGTDREALALELGYKNFNAAPPEAKKEINAEVKRREDERIQLAAEKEIRLADQYGKNLSVQERRLNLQEEQQRRLLPSQQKVLTSNKNTMQTIDEFTEAYKEFAAESKGGTVSDTFRGAIAKNRNAKIVADLVKVEGRTPAERKFAAAYNAIVGNIRAVTDEVGVLTDIDAYRILGSFDPAQDQRQVLANLAARRRTHERSYNAAIEDYSAMGKDVSGFVKQGVTKPKQDGTVQRSKSKSGKPIISKDGGKTWEYE